MPAFLSGFVYYINCTYIKSGDTYGRHKYAIVLTSGNENVCVFFINTKINRIASSDSQLFVTPEDISSLPHESYIDTFQHKMCAEQTCLVERIVGRVPDPIIEKIRLMVESSRTISPMVKDKILYEFS